jgi:hypothetical protein
VTVLQACVRTLGVHRGAIAAAQVAQWALVTAELGRVPTTAEYAEYWAVIERTGWNHRANVRRVFGDDWQSVVEQLADEISRRRVRGPGKVVGLGVPAGAVPAA